MPPPLPSLPQPPYVLLVSRLVDTDPMLVLRSFQAKTANVWNTHLHLGADAAAQAAANKQLALPPAEYVRGGQPARSEWPSWWRHSWPPRAPRAASEGLRPPTSPSSLRLTMQASWWWATCRECRRGT